MHNKVHSFKAKLSSHLNVARQIYRDFRLYDLGSYALNRFTPKAGYSAERHLAYGLKARQRFDLYRSAQPLAHRPLIVFVHGGAWLHGDKRE